MKTVITFKDGKKVTYSRTGNFTVNSYLDNKIRFIQHEDNQELKHIVLDSSEVESYRNIKDTGDIHLENYDYLVSRVNDVFYWAKTSHYTHKKIMEKLEEKVYSDPKHKKIGCFWEGALYQLIKCKYEEIEKETEFYYKFPDQYVPGKLLQGERLHTAYLYPSGRLWKDTLTEYTEFYIL